MTSALRGAHAIEQRVIGFAAVIEGANQASRVKRYAQNIEVRNRHDRAVTDSDSTPRTRKARR
jgi:hypothetical protein